jgi:Glycosyl hydrolase family 1
MTPSTLLSEPSNNGATNTPMTVNHQTDRPPQAGGLLIIRTARAIVFNFAQTRSPAIRYEPALPMPTRFTRRQLSMVGASTLGASATAAPSGARPGDGAAAGRETSRAFPAGFLWGTATAAYQIEGAGDRLDSAWFGAGPPELNCSVRLP